MGKGKAEYEFCKRKENVIERIIFKLELSECSKSDNGKSFDEKIIRGSPRSKEIAAIIHEIKCKIAIGR